MWSDEAMKEAIDIVNSGSRMRAASIKFGIPYFTLREWCYGVQQSRKCRLNPTLNATEE